MVPFGCRTRLPIKEIPNRLNKQLNWFCWFTFSLIFIYLSIFFFLSLFRLSHTNNENKTFIYCSTNVCALFYSDLIWKIKNLNVDKLEISKQQIKCKREKKKQTRKINEKLFRCTFSMWNGIWEREMKPKRRKKLNVAN